MKKFSYFTPYSLQPSLLTVSHTLRLLLFIISLELLKEIEKVKKLLAVNSNFLCVISIHMEITIFTDVDDDVLATVDTVNDRA